MELWTKVSRPLERRMLRWKYYMKLYRKCHKSDLWMVWGSQFILNLLGIDAAEYYNGAMALSVDFRKTETDTVSW